MMCNIYVVHLHVHVILVHHSSQRVTCIHYNLVIDVVFVYRWF